MLHKFGKLCHALRFAYPDQEWDEEKFSEREKKAEQR
jgi:hypothetical protein